MTGLAIAAVAALTISAVGVALARVTANAGGAAATDRGSQAAFEAADRGAGHGFSEILEMGRSRGRFPTATEIATIAGPATSNVRFPVFRVTAGRPRAATVLTTGFFEGMVAATQPFTVTATAEMTADPTDRAAVSMTAEFDIIPVFQFAVLYEEDLEILPGPEMVLAGPVHSNADVYIDTDNSLALDAGLTAAGRILNHRKDDGSKMPGTVRIRGADGRFRAMAGLDSIDPKWATQALDRWGGNVRSGEHDVERLDLTIEDPQLPRRIIEPGRPGDSPRDRDSKIWYEAGLRIVNGQGFDASGSAVSIVDPLTRTSAARHTVIFDHRERRYVLASEIDIGKLGRSPGYPDNGIVYVGGFEPGGGMVSWQGGGAGVGPAEWAGYDPPWSGTGASVFGVKLTNGAELDTALTVVSDNAVYVGGDYNTVGKKSAAILADAVNILSNGWGDVDGDGAFDGDLAYSRLALSSRNARSTRVNAALMVGNEVTDPGLRYAGGVENVPRLLESWSGATLTLRGSIVVLWRSIHATGDWGCGAPTCAPPHRDWGFDESFLAPHGLPPGTPNVYSMRVIGWERS